jgi:hypothetical protein
MTDNNGSSGGKVIIQPNITVVIEGGNLPPIVPEGQGLQDLLAALNLTEAAAQRALIAVQHLDLFERWVITATSPDALENVVLPSLIRAPGQECTSQTPQIMRISSVHIIQTKHGASVSQTPWCLSAAVVCFMHVHVPASCQSTLP